MFYAVLFNFSAEQQNVVLFSLQGLIQSSAFFVCCCFNLHYKVQILCVKPLQLGVFSSQFFVFVLGRKSPCAMCLKPYLSLTKSASFSVSGQKYQQEVVYDVNCLLSEYVDESAAIVMTSEICLSPSSVYISIREVTGIHIVLFKPLSTNKVLCILLLKENKSP